MMPDIISTHWNARNLFIYCHNIVYALELAVAKYQPLNRYSSSCIQAFPVALRGLFLYYCLLYIRTYWPAFLLLFIIHSNILTCLSLFIIHVVRIIINSEWYRCVRGCASVRTCHV